MGRTFTKKREDDWGDSRRSNGKNVKHSRNHQGVGMRFINSMSDYDYDEESDYEYDDKYDDDTSVTQRKGK